MELFGKLTLAAFPIHEPPAVAAVIAMILGVVALAILVTYLKRWKWLWKEWFTSVDHKKIGIMYIIVAILMLVRGFADAIMMRTQMAMASAGDGQGYLPPSHYDQIFTAHGVIMIFFMAMPFMVGLMNIVVPLQIGARDVAFPYLNNLSFWLFVVGVVLMNVSLGAGNFARTGWLAYPPLSEKLYSPDVGVDYWIWALQISGLGTLLSGVNFLVTILKMRAPGMTLMKMPLFTWNALCANILILAIFPVLTATIAMLTLDRYLGFHFFTNTLGGNPMMYVNLIWIWGHPEVYVLILPAFGVYSELVATFSRKKLFGYTSLIWATCAIMVLGFSVWLHHFFTMGAGANVNAFFGIATMIISIPTGLKLFNWIFTMYRGRVTFPTPMKWMMGFFLTFTIGGMTGVLLAVPGADFVLHNSQFLIAHFHNTIIGGVVFGYLAGYNYWFPKATGIKLNQRWGDISFWFWIVGFFVAFMPLYYLGFEGMTRRTSYNINPAWHPYLVLAAIGSVLILLGILSIVIQLVVSIVQHKKNRDVTGDPWDGRTLEWASTSPPPFYNFAITPKVQELDAFWDDKQKGVAFKRPKKYLPIHMPSNTSAGIFMGIFGVAFGFSMIWEIWWLAILGLVLIIALWIAKSFCKDDGYMVPVEEIERIENARYEQLEKAGVKVS